MLLQTLYRFLAKHLNPKAEPVGAVSFELIAERHARDLLLAPNQTLPAHAHMLNGKEVLTASLEEGEGPIAVLVDPRGAEIASRSSQAKEL